MKKILSIILVLCGYICHAQTVTHLSGDKDEYENVSYDIVHDLKLVPRPADNAGFRYRATSGNGFRAKYANIWHSPADGDIDVALDQTIDLVFNDQMTLTDIQSYVSVSGSVSGPVAGFWVQSGRAFTFTPSVNYEDDELVTVSITDDLVGTDGKWIPQNYSWSFTPLQRWSPIADPAFEAAIELTIGTDGTPGFVRTNLIEGLTNLDVSNSGIISLEGILAFEALTYLDVTQNYLTELDVSWITDPGFVLEASDNPDLFCIGVAAIQEAGLNADPRIAPYDSWDLGVINYDQSCSRFFVFKVQVESSDLTFSIPSANTVNGFSYDVDWGDGTSQTLSTLQSWNVLSHTYAAAGDYNVTISGDFPGFRFTLHPDDAARLMAIEQWGNIQWRRMDNAFSYCTNVEINTADTPDLTFVTNMTEAFYQTSGFNGDISSWDVSNVSNMTRMFMNAESFNQDISGWDVSSVENMELMFANAFAFNQNLNSWNVQNVSNLSQMFSNATSFNSSLTDWDLSGLTELDRVFYGATAFNGDLSGWDVGHIVTMENLFRDAISFNQDISSWDISNVENMGGMFMDANSFDQDLSSWDIGSVNNLINMLNGTALSTTNYDNLLIGWSTLEAGESIPSNLYLGAEGLISGCAGDPGRTELTSTYGWTIHDGGSMCLDDMFITTWQTTTPNESITILTNSTGNNYLIDWGDGTITTNNFGDETHEYTTPGVYEIKISGGFPRFYMNNHSAMRDKLLTVEQWGPNQWTSMERAFWGCSNLTINATDQPNLTDVTSMANMFRDASSFNANVATWDISNVTNLSGAFAKATSFNNDISGWDVSGVMNMGGMFAGATSFNQDLSGWDVSEVENISSMFSGATSFQSDLSNWDVSSVNNMTSTFLNASSFTSDLSNWDVSQVTSMVKMFEGASLFDSDLSAWDIGNVTSMEDMLINCALSNANYEALLNGWSTINPGENPLQLNVTLDVDATYGCLSESANADLTDNYGWTITDFGNECTASQFITTWEVTDTNKIIVIRTTGGDYDYRVNWGDGTFSYNRTADEWHTYASAGTYTVSISGDFPRIYFNNDVAYKDKILTVEQWGPNQWTSMEGAFYGCSNLNINATDAPDLSLVTNMNEMFREATALNADLSSWDVSNVGHMSGLFQGATAFDGNIDNWDVSGATDMSSMFAYASSFDRNLMAWNVGNVENMSSMFFFASAFNRDLNTWNTNGVTDMSNMFSWAEMFNGNIANWDVSNVSNMGNMFLHAIAFNSDISAWQTSRVNHFSGMFYEAYAFNQNISNWDVSGSTYLGRMFRDATSFNQDLLGWDVSAVTNMDYMFYNASSFNGDISNWDVSSVESMNNTFWSASAFNSDISSWNVSSVINMNRAFANAASFNADISGWDVSGIENMTSMLGGATSFDQDLSSWDIGSVQSMAYMLSNSGISQANYDAILNGWSTQDVGESPIPSNIRLDAGGLTYSCLGSVGRELLVNTYGWTINDDSNLCTADMFITTWQTTSSNESITIPTAGGVSYNYFVDWGDGHYSYNQSGDALHVYSSPGIHTVSISGDFPHLYFNNIETSNNDKLLSVEQWGSIEWTNMHRAFLECSNLVLNATDAPDLTLVTDMSSMFSEASSLTGDLSNWDVSGVTNMSRMFEDASSFNSDLSGWDVSSLEESYRMFQHATSFNSNLSGWQVSNVENMLGMFHGASSFNSNLGGWNIDQVTDMRNMLINSGLSVSNYDATLIGWSTLDAGETVIPSGLELGADGLSYCNSQTERDNLINTHNWTIIGDTYNCVGARMANGVETDVEEELVSENTEVITLYPNPAGDYFTLQIPELINPKLEVYDLSGALIIQQRILQIGENRIKTHGLNDGFVIIRVLAENYSHTQKLMIER